MKIKRKTSMIDVFIPNHFEYNDIITTIKYLSYFWPVSYVFKFGSWKCQVAWIDHLYNVVVYGSCSDKERMQLIQALDDFDKNHVAQLAPGGLIDDFTKNVRNALREKGIKLV